jgi:hypothetical protein
VAGAGEGEVERKILETRKEVSWWLPSNGVLGIGGTLLLF